MRKSNAILLGLLGVAALGFVLAQGMFGAPPDRGYGYGYGYGGYGYGMMGGYDGWYGGMMGPGMMGAGMMGAGMMGGVYLPDARPIDQAEAVRRIQDFVARVTPGAKVKDVMAFSQNYYAQIVDDKGRGLGEVIVDRYTGVVYPEPGPNMMWNGASRYFRTNPRYDLEAAKDLAKRFLAGYLPGAEILEAQAFDGYYTFDFGRGKIEGMLSVNAYSGEVWVHTWHGVFLGE